MTARGIGVKTLTFILLFVASANAREIPLDSVWAFKMPDTRNIQELEPRLNPNLSIEEMRKRSRLWQMRDVLRNRPKRGYKAGPAIVVVGKDKEALENAHAALLAKDKGKETPREMPLGKDLSLLFYSYLNGSYCKIVSAEIEDEGEKATNVYVYYQFVGHSETISTAHFALIPLGQPRTREGIVRVYIEQVPPVNQFGETLPKSDARHIVSDTFTFGVLEASKIKKVD
jgi:hypothetical protein